MKKTFITVIACLFVIGLTPIQSSCHPHYAWSDVGVTWYSEEPEIVIIRADEYSLDGYLIANGNEKLFYFAWGPSKRFYVINPNTKEDAELKESSFFYGTFSFKNNTAILTIEQDNVFGGKYKKIVLRKKLYVKGEYSFSPTKSYYISSNSYEE